ncbi:hypothetical protein HYS72_02765 [Candidatus Pacearchaeota archaeon]|nr:hypothetical protein [Candidatus Pacearchaeota archaeon]MBI2056922.1 hypothetical protein [Candidatus Pacearchaeota archaeon]
MDSEIQSQTPETEPSAGESSEEQPKKRKISMGNIIILIILLAIIGVAVYYYLGNESELGNCSSANECGRYNVFYISGEGYVCANDQTVGEGTIKTKLLMFKYASKKATTNEPADCSCIENQCESFDEFTS